MTDSELHEAIRGLYRIEQLGMLDELKRRIATAMRANPIPANPKHDHRYLAVSMFSRDVAGILGIDHERAERAAMAIYIPSRETIALNEIWRMLAWLDGQSEIESVDSMNHQELARPPLTIVRRKPA